jgi:hypothetical protein
LLGRLLAPVLGRRAAAGEQRDGAAEDRGEAARRIEAAQERLKQAIPPPEDPPS